MSKRALVLMRVSWVAATLALMAWWREEALVLLVPLVLLGPLVRGVSPAAGEDERERYEDYRSSHVALMSTYALLFVILAKQQFEDGTGIAAEWILMFAVPLLVRAGLSLGRGLGARRLGLTVGAAAGAAWFGFSLLSHGVSWATLAESWIGGGILLFTLVASRWPRAGGALLACLSIGLFALVSHEALGQGRWAFGLSMTAVLVLPPLLAGVALLASAPTPRQATADEFSDLRSGPGAGPGAHRSGAARLPRAGAGGWVAAAGAVGGGACGGARGAAPGPHGSGPARIRRAGAVGWIAAAVAFVGCASVLAVLAAAPSTGPSADFGPRKESLETPRDIDGVPCAVRAFYAAGGRLQTCTLSRDHEFPNGLRLAAGTQVTLDAEGRPATAFLPENTVLDGHTCIGDGTHNPMTNFHPNGKLRFCNLAEPQTIQGIPCQRSAFWLWITQGGAGVYFHDNGALHECLLADDVTVEGRVFRKRQHISLDREGVPVATVPGQ